jgi:elongation factor G
MLKYLEGEELSVEEIKGALRKGTLATKIVPVLCGSSFKNKGVQPLLDAVVDYLPAPSDLPPVEGTDLKTGETATRPLIDDAPFSALAFKIMTDPYVGKLAFFRVYSGVLTAGSYVYNSSKGKRAHWAHSADACQSPRGKGCCLFSGEIAAAVGLKNTTTGDTLTDEGAPIVA